MSHVDRHAKTRDISTADGQKVQLLANVGSPEDIKFVFQQGLEGVGLFRTEFLLMEHGRLPTEEEQLAIYQAAVKQLANRHLVIRTFDIGADKQVPGLTVCTGQNPALGIRGIRRHLTANAREFRSQLRAILRAGAGPLTSIMIPMVTTVEDVRAARKHLLSVHEELCAEGLMANNPVRFGAMIEVPAAAIAVKEILTEADFVSLGTNDLLQYFTAADRDNEDVVMYNDPESRPFLWLLEYIIKSAAEMGRERDVTICGEIASRPNLIPRLLRLGYRSFSIVPVMADPIREAIRSTNLKHG
jgi:phosphotransferase system enzyme I (PtsI)